MSSSWHTKFENKPTTFAENILNINDIKDILSSILNLFSVLKIPKIIEKRYIGIIFSLIFNIVISSTSNAITLEQKLQKQYEKYNNAREELLILNSNNKIPLKDRIISRDAWEDIIKLNPDFTLTKQNLLTLSQKHKEIILHSKEKSQTQSFFDLQKLRNLPSKQRKKEINKFCSLIPKGALLHVHQSGSLDKKIIYTLLKKSDPKIPFEDLSKELQKNTSGAFLYSSELKRLQKMGTSKHFSKLNEEEQRVLLKYFVLPNGKHPFGRFEACFKFIKIALNDWDAIASAVLSYAKKVSNANVSYLELMTSGLKPELMSKFHKLADECYKKYGVTVRFIYAFYRTAPVEKNIEKLTILLNDLQKDPYVVGVTLIGDENLSSALSAGQTIYSVLLNDALDKKTRLKRTIHAGEMGDLRNTRDAAIFGVNRVGHATNLMENPIVVEYYRRIKLPITICLSSNLRLTHVENISNHAFLDYYRLGIPITLNTDDPGIFEINSNDECNLAVSNTDITYKEIKDIYLKSYDSALINDQEKSNLKQKLKQQFKQFESQYKNMSPFAIGNK